MKTTLAMVVALCIATSALASSQGLIEKDANGAVVQGGAPNGLFSAVLTGRSITTDQNGLWWAVYSSVDCKGRLMPTASKGSYPQFTIPGGTWTSRVVNRATPFVNFSGCVGDLQRQ